MKELSIKAKAYDEALSLMQDCIPDEDGLVHVKPEEIFPELKESEDERIRKELIEYHKAQAFLDGKPNNKHVKYVAWLEKRGEQKTIKEHNVCDFCEEKASCINPCPMKLVEQKPAVIIPKFKVGDVMRTLQEAADNITDGMPVVVSIDEEYYHCTNELIAIKDQDDYEYPPMNRRQKPAWSEEDEDIIEWLIGYLEYQIMNATIPEEKNNCLDAISMLKSLRPHNNVTDEELIQAKKEAYNDALDKIEYHSGEPTFDDGWSAAIWYLKKRNAQPQNRWKPSYEQIKVLEFFIPYVTKCSVVLQKSKDTLLSLLSDLKKLREE